MQKIKELEKILNETGLNDKEICIYTTLFEMGGGGYPSVIAKYAKLNRSTTYKVLISLSIKGLINEIEKKNKVFYQLNKPYRLAKYVEQKSNLLSIKADKIKDLLPDLNNFFQGFTSLPKVLFFEGLEEVLGIYDDMTGYKDYEMLSVFNAKEFEKFLGNKALQQFVKKREAMNISMRAILPSSKEDVGYTERVYGRVSKNIFPNVRNISSEEFFFDGDITIYGKNKIAMIKLNKDVPKSQLIGVIIEDKTIYGMMKMIFELAWKGTNSESLCSSEQTKDKN